MKFTDLYSKIFVSEKADASEIADPQNFDDVEPMPLPEPSAPEAPMDAMDDASAAVPQQPSVNSSSVSDYINELESFANKLNGTEPSSLQSVVSQLDRPGTPFDGISSRTRGEIVRVAETLRSISENLKSFIINASKK